ncbi:MAG: DUF7693 family protein [Pseudomonas sp.]
MLTPYFKDSTSPDGLSAAMEVWQRYCTNPVDLLSNWEHAQLEQLLSAL